MNRAEFARTSITIAAVGSAAMGAFHFALPTLFGWGRFTQTLPAPIEWGVFALNAFFSLLLLVGSLASLRAIWSNTAEGWSIGMMAAFWVFNSAYQLVRPFPAPRVRWALLSFAAVVAVLYLVGLAMLKRNETYVRPSGPTI